MGHQHSHHESHSHHHHGKVHHGKAFFVATLLNFLFVVIEAIYAVMAHSMSLLADAGHNIGDVAGLALSWTASWLLTRPASERYSYGYKKTTVLAALANALLLTFATSIIAYESVTRFIHPHAVTEQIIIIVASIGIVINGGTALLFIKNQKDDLNVKSAFIHLAGDAAISLGVVITGIIIFYTKWLWLDPVIGLLLAVTILGTSMGLMRDSVNLVLDAVPHHIDQSKVRNYLSNLKGVTAVHDLHIWGLSTREVALTAHLVIPEHTFSDDDFYHVNHALKHQFHIDHVTLQVERGVGEHVCPLIVIPAGCRDPGAREGKLHAHE
jgi:cobalt-zinc-cadmium efflux system protein